MRASRASTSFLCCAFSASSAVCVVGQLLLLRVAVLDRRVVEVFVDATAGGARAWRSAAEREAIICSLHRVLLWRGGRSCRSGRCRTRGRGCRRHPCRRAAGRWARSPSRGWPAAAGASDRAVPEPVQQRGALLDLRRGTSPPGPPPRWAGGSDSVAAPSSRTASRAASAWAATLTSSGLFRCVSPPPTAGPARRPAASATARPSAASALSMWREPAGEPIGRVAQRLLGVEAQLARQVDHREQQRRRARAASPRDRRRARASSSSRSSSSILARGPSASGQSKPTAPAFSPARVARSRAGALLGMPSSAPCLPFSAFSTAFSLAQLASTASASLADDVAEDVRVAAHQLGDDAARDVVDAELAPRRSAARTGRRSAAADRPAPRGDRRRPRRPARRPPRRSPRPGRGPASPASARGPRGSRRAPAAAA